MKTASLIRRFAGLNLGAALFVLAALPAAALTTNYWTGGGSGANWQTSANWNAAAAAGNVLSFGGTTQTLTTNDFPADTSFAGINFTNTVAGAAFTNYGNEIVLGGYIVATATNASATPIQDTVAHDLVLQVSQRVIGTNYHTIALTGNITFSNAAAGSLTLDYWEAGALNGAGGAINFNGLTGLTFNDYYGPLHSGTITLSRAINSISNVTLTANSPTVIYNGAYTVTGSAGTLKLQGAGTGANNFQTAISGNNIVIDKEQAGNWTLSGLYSSSCSGVPITVAGGTLTINNDNNSFTSGGIVATIYTGCQLNLTSLKDLGTPCALGIGYPNAKILMGTSAGTATLNYIGGGDYNNRNIQIGNVATSPANAMVMNNGTNGGTGLHFTAGQFVLTAGSTNHILFLGGTNTDNNEIWGVIVDSTSPGTNSLVKTNSGTWNLIGMNSYSGPTTIAGGKLVGRTGRGCLNSVVTVSNTAGCVLGVAITDNTKGWTNAGVTFAGANAGLDFNYGSVSPGTTVAPIQVNGNVAFTGTPTVTIEAANFPAGTGTYPLMTWTGSSSGTAPTTATLPRRMTGTLSVTGNTLYLNATNNEPLFWNTGNGTWDTVATNWVDASYVTPAVYSESPLPGDMVEFAWGTGPITVTLNSIVTPARVRVTAPATDFIFSGTGGIAGSTAFFKWGASTLTVNTTNTYTGWTWVTAGTLLVNGNESAVTNTWMVTTNATLGGSGTIGGAVILEAGASATNVVGSPLTVTNSLTLNGNAMNVSTLSALGAGDYLLITNTAAAISGSFAAVNVSGAGVAGTASIVTTPDAVTLHVAASSAPGNFSGISVSGTTLTLNVTNGPANGAWTLLSSTNVATPLSQWTTNRTGNYDGSGNLSTNLLNTATNPMEFFILK